MALYKLIFVFLLMTHAESNLQQQRYVSAVYPNHITTATISNRFTTNVLSNRTSEIVRTIGNVTTPSQRTRAVVKEASYDGYASLIRSVMNIRLRAEIIIALMIIAFCAAIIIVMCLWKAHDNERMGEENIRPH